MEISKRIHSLTMQAEKNLEDLDPKQVNQFLESISEAKKIIATGRGRSKLIAQLFAIRLHNLSKRVTVVGEGVMDISPPVKKGTLVVAISGSGETQDVITYVEHAKEVGAEIFVITSNAKSTLAKIAKYCIIVKGRTQKWEYKDFLEREFSKEYEPLTLEGSMFEISTMIFLEGVSAELAKRRS